MTERTTQILLWLWLGFWTGAVLLLSIAAAHFIVKYW